MGMEGFERLKQAGNIVDYKLEDIPADSDNLYDIARLTLFLPDGKTATLEVNVTTEGGKKWRNSFANKEVLRIVEISNGH